MSNTTLLPPNATAQEIALDLATSRVGDVPIPIRDLWNAETCPNSLLSWLAWAFGVDVWDNKWSDDTKRQTIRSAVEVQRRKGSVWSIKEVIRAAGYGNSVLLEGNSNNFYNGAFTHNGLKTYGDVTEWARYRFVLTRPISNAQAAQIRSMLDYTAPARCHLIEMIFTEAANLYDGAITYNGAYNHGVA